jgi:hypothetical protein
MEKHPIDQIFRDKLVDFERNPPVGLLDQIQQRVAYQGKVRRLNQVRTILGAAAALVLILLAGWYTSTTEQYAGNNLPAISQPQGSPVMSTSENRPQATPVAKNQQLASLEQNHAASKVKKAKQFKPATLASVPIKSGTGNEGKEQLANQAANAVIPAATDGNGQTAAVKGERNPEPASKTTKRAAELPYFADANFAPTTRQSGSAKGSWGIKAELSPMFAAQNQANASGEAVTKSINTVCGGMMAAYKVNDRLSISTGLRFAQMKQGTHTTYALNAKSGITYLEPVEKSANIAGDVSLNLPSKSSIVYFNGMQNSPTNITGSDISQDFKYLEIPVQATYKVLDSKFSLGVTGGISTNILVGNLASIKENGIKLTNGNTQNLRDVIYAGSAGIELGYGLGKNLVLTVEPRLKQYMHSVSSNDQINYKPLQMGIFTGLTYSFQ